ncbi:MAG: hypothetical protein EP332_08605 [Bacteroidetes bacterium]|nr:MAG: hypothetical protein EP332_08605 [Bacteroidota bacterium]
MNKIIIWIAIVTIYSSCHRSQIIEIEKQLSSHKFSKYDPEISSFIDREGILEISFDSLLLKYRLIRESRRELYKELYSRYSDALESEYLKRRYIEEYYEDWTLTMELIDNEIISHTFHVGFVPDPYPNQPNMLRIEARIDYQEHNKLPYFVQDGTSDTTVLDVDEDSILIPNENANDTVSGNVWIFDTQKRIWSPYWIQIVPTY